MKFLTKHYIYGGIYDMLIVGSAWLEFTDIYKLVNHITPDYFYKNTPIKWPAFEGRVYDELHVLVPVWKIQSVYYNTPFDSGKPWSTLGRGKKRVWHRNFKPKVNQKKHEENRPKDRYGYDRSRHRKPFVNKSWKKYRKHQYKECTHTKTN